MCTAATYKTKDFYFGRTLDYEFSYGEEITITPRNYKFNLKNMGIMETHYAMIGMAHIAEIIRFIMTQLMKKVLVWQDLTLSAMRIIKK